MRWFIEYLLPRAYPALDWIQVEITSHCNGDCVYCPHSAYRANWADRYLSLEAFQKLVPAFKKTAYVHLQGWGEPFVHPDFFEMAATAKKAGCAVGTTTNGSLLTSESIERLVGEEIDVVAFSLAGPDERNDAVRSGTSLKAVLGAIEEIHRLKAAYKSKHPKIHIAYMLLRSARGDLEKLSAFFGNLGVDQVVLSSLSLVVRRELEAESFFSIPQEEFLELRRDLADFRDKAAGEGVPVFFNIVSPLIENTDCSENIQRALVIGSDGVVSPCVMTNIPAQNENFHYSEGVERHLPRIEFGNVLNTTISNIWARREYERFRGSFRQRRQYDACKGCLKRRIDDVSDPLVG
jgi:MoaA/NifB/PqqE/SkfB family radical SAM enzyme